MQNQNSNPTPTPVAVRPHGHPDRQKVIRVSVPLLTKGNAGKGGEIRRASTPDSPLRSLSLLDGWAGTPLPTPGVEREQSSKESSFPDGNPGKKWVAKDGRLKRLGDEARYMHRARGKEEEKENKGMSTFGFLGGEHEERWSSDSRPSTSSSGEFKRPQIQWGLVDTNGEVSNLMSISSKGVKDNVARYLPVKTPFHQHRNTKTLFTNTATLEYLIKSVYHGAISM